MCEICHQFRVGCTLVYDPSRRGRVHDLCAVEELARLREGIQESHQIAVDFIDLLSARVTSWEEALHHLEAAVGALMAIRDRLEERHV